MPTDIHVICKHQEKLNWRRIEGNTFETGIWTVAKRTAEEATQLGGRVYLHEHQKDPAWHGGDIISWSPSPEAGRVRFTYAVNGDFRVKCLTGWSQEIAIVRR